MALRIAAAHLAGAPDRTVASFAAELGRGDRLSALHVDGDPRSAVRAAFDISFGRQDEPTRRLFRLFALLDIPEIGAITAAHMLDTPSAVTADALDALTGAHLVDTTGSGRYRMHDLLRLWARERLLADESDAVRRVAARQLERVTVARRMVFPVFDEGAPAAGSSAGPSFLTANEALSWFRTEQQTIFAVVQAVSELPGCHMIAAELVATMARLALTVVPRDRWTRAIDAGLDAARAAGEPQLVARLLNSQGLSLADQGDYHGAAALFSEAGNVCMALNDSSGQLHSWLNQAVARHMIGQVHEAVEGYRTAMRMARAANDRRMLGYALANLAAAHRDLSRYDEAMQAARSAREVLREIDDRQGEADALDDLAQSMRAAGHIDDAIEHR